MTFPHFLSGVCLPRLSQRLLGLHLDESVGIYVTLCVISSCIRSLLTRNDCVRQVMVPGTSIAQCVPSVPSALRPHFPSYYLPTPSTFLMG